MQGCDDRPRVWRALLRGSAIVPWQGCRTNRATVTFDGIETINPDTSWRVRFGTSTPMADLPGMGARMRTSGDAMA